MSNYRGSKMGDIDYKVISRVGVLNSYSTGWTKEVNIISWNGGTPKVDIRDWDAEHEHMSRGITLHEEEAELMIKLLERKFSNMRKSGKQRFAEADARDAEERRELERLEAEEELKADELDDDELNADELETKELDTEELAFDPETGEVIEPLLDDLSGIPKEIMEAALEEARYA